MREQDKGKIGFVYTFEHLGADGVVKSVEVVKNIIPIAAVNYMIGAAFAGASQYTSWYVSVFNNNRLPVTGDTMTTFLADCGENTDYTTTANARLAITFPAVDTGAIDTSVSPNVFTFASGATIRGAFITTNITRSNTSGLLTSAVLLSSPKVVGVGESLRVPVGFALISA